MKRVGIFVFPLVEELDFIGVYEVLAKTWVMKNEGSLPIKKGLTVEVVAFEENISCANGLVVKPHRIIDSFDDYDILVIPGGRGINRLLINREFLRDVTEFAKVNMICSVCTGSLILAEAGVLQGRRATTHHKSKEKLRRYCEVVDSRVVVDGDIITAGGVSCSLDLGLKLVEIIYDKSSAQLVAKRLEIPYDSQ